VVFVATKNSQYEKVVSNIEEVRSRGGHVTRLRLKATSRSASCVKMSSTCGHSRALAAHDHGRALQLMAYHAAVLRGKDVDKPRNLAKSVTVE